MVYLLQHNLAFVDETSTQTEAEPVAGSRNAGIDQSGVHGFLTTLQVPSTFHIRVLRSICSCSLVVNIRCRPAHTLPS